VNVVWYRFRTAFRSRARTYAGIVLLLGLMGGVALASVAGARRTVSAFPRFRHSTNPSDIQVDLGPYDPDAVDAIRHLPQVARTATYVAAYAVPLLPDGQPDFSFTDMEGVASLDGLYLTQDRFTPTQGRLPDPSREDEVAVNANVARIHHLRVGQRLEIGVWTRQAIESPGAEGPGPPADRLAVSIVGVGLFNDEVVQDQADRNSRMLYTPAFTRRELPRALYFWSGLKLHNGGADVGPLKRDYGALLDANGGGDAPEFFRVNSVITTSAQRAVRPLGVALGVFGALAGLATLLLVGQAVARLMSSEGEDLAILRAMGAGPALTSFVGAPAAAASVIVGVVVAAAVAFALSWFTPIGPVRPVEVHPGFSLDWAVIGLGAATFVVCLGLITAVAGARQAPHRKSVRAATGHQRSSTAGAAATAGFPVPAVVGMRLALETGGGRTAAPVRAAMTGAVVAVVALVASLTFGASLNSLVHHPRLFGWAWDATIIDSSGYGNVNDARAHELLDSDPAVAAWSGVYFASVEVDGRNVAAMGVDPGSAVFPPLRSGHEVRGSDEIVLGARTLSDLHKRIGDSVVVGRGERAGPMRVVGSAVLPTIGIGHGAYTSLGTGVALPSDKLPGLRRNAGAGAVGPNAIFLRFRPRVDRVAAVRRIAAKADAIGDQPGNAVLLPVQRPAEIVNSSHMGAAPVVLAGGMAVAVLASLGLGLASGVRRRRQDLALLKALGFTRGQLSATVTWQAVITVLVGLAFGVPMGVALGRWLWVGFARQLSVLASPSLPAALLAGLAGGLLVVAILAAAAPARLAGRTRVATILHSE
jgi:hypothetical protein